MADDTTWESDLEAALSESADTPAEAEEATSLDADSPPEGEDQEAAEETPEDETTQTDEAETESEPESTEQVAVATEPEKPNWDSEDNPHFRISREYQEKQAQARVLVEQMAAKRAQELQAERIRALSDDDPQRVVEIQQLVSDAQRPVLERAQSLEGEVEFAAKLATVVEAAVAHVLNPDDHKKVLAEVERMMALPGGPDYLQRDLQTRKAERTQYAELVSAKDQKIAELERRLTAQAKLKERRDNGADHVDSNTGVSKGFQARYDQASGEEALDILLEDLIPH